MDIAKEVFARKRVIIDRLTDAGFNAVVKCGDDAAGEHGETEYIYSESFMNGDLTAVIKVLPNGRVACSAVDSETGDEFLPMNIEAHTGSYVGEAREEYSKLLEKVASECFDDVEFMSDQANRIAAEIERELGVLPEHPFKGDDAAVFRHGKSGKWFAIDMCIRRSKLDDPNVSSDNQNREMLDVMNVKIDPDKLNDLLKEPGICRCYHMNKKMWVTLTMDDRLSDDRIMELMRRSFELTVGGAASRRSRTGAGRAAGGRGLAGAGGTAGGAAGLLDSDDRAYWLIPSNPATFDVAKGFRDSGNNTLDWHHRISVMPGDIVYIYQTEPVASIMFECEVLESFLPRPASWGEYAQSSKYRMTLKLLRSFKKGEYPRSWMNEHGVAKTVRGQRSAPTELAQAISASD